MLWGTVLLLTALPEALCRYQSSGAPLSFPSTFPAPLARMVPTESSILLPPVVMCWRSAPYLGQGISWPAYGAATAKGENSSLRP